MYFYFYLTGPGVSVKIVFDPDPENLDPLPIQQVTIGNGKTSKQTGNEVYDSELNENAEWKFRPKEIVITFEDEEESEADAADVHETPKKD